MVCDDFYRNVAETDRNFRHEITAFAHQGLKWELFCVMLQMIHSKIVNIRREYEKNVHIREKEDEGMGKCIQGKSYVTVIDPVFGYEFCRTSAGEQGRQPDYQ